MHAAALDLEGTLHDAHAAHVALLPVGSIDELTFRRFASMLRGHATAPTRVHCATGSLPIRFVEHGASGSAWDELYPQRRPRAIVGLCQASSDSDLAPALRSFAQRIARLMPATKGWCLIFESIGVPMLRNALPRLPQMPTLRYVAYGRTESADAAMRKTVKEISEEVSLRLLAEMEAPPSSVFPATPADSGTGSERMPVLRLLSSSSSRMSGRQLKRAADFKLMCGLASDAKATYERALECLPRSGADAVWHAAAAEGASAAHLAYVSWHLREGEQIGEAVDEASDAYADALASSRRRLEDAAMLCAARGGHCVEIGVEIAFRLVRLLQETATYERARATMQAGDITGTDVGELPPPPSTWRHRLIDAQQRLHRLGFELVLGADAPLGHQLQLRVCLAAASLSLSLGQRRKAAFYMLEAARRYRNVLEWQGAHELLLMAAPHIRLAPLQCLQLRGAWRASLPIDPHSPPAAAAGECRSIAAAAAAGECGSIHVEAGAVLAPHMVGAKYHSWSNLHQVVLAMLMEAAEAVANPSLYVSYSLFSLRLLNSTLPPEVQARFVGLLQQSARLLPPMMPAPGIGLPWLVSLSPVQFPALRQPYRLEPSITFSGQDVGLFTFSPFEARREHEKMRRAAEQVIWVVGEEVHAIVELTNPLCVPLRIDHVALHCTVQRCAELDSSARACQATTATPQMDGGVGVPDLHFIPFGRGVELPPHSHSAPLDLYGHVHAHHAGTHISGRWAVCLHGVEVHAYGVVCIHPIDAHGQGASLPINLTSRSMANNTHSAFYCCEHEKQHSFPLDRITDHWKPPPGICVPLVAPLPLLATDMPSVPSGAFGDLHVGQQTQLVLRLTNVGALPVHEVQASVQRLADTGELVAGGPFAWYMHSPSMLYVHYESASVCTRHDLEVEHGAVGSQLPLSPSQQLCIPVRVRIGKRNPLSAQILLDYRAAPAAEADCQLRGMAVDGDGMCSNFRETAQPSVGLLASWTRKLALSLQFAVTPGLVLAPAITVHGGRQHHFMRPKSAESTTSAAPRTCLVALQVINEHCSTSFHLEAHLRQASSIAPTWVEEDIALPASMLKWVVAPGACEQLLLPLGCILHARHPLPQSAALLEEYLEVHQPPLTSPEKDMIRAVHRLKAVIMTTIDLRWRRLGRHGGQGGLSLLPVRLSGSDVGHVQDYESLFHGTISVPSSRTTSALFHQYRRLERCWVDAPLPQYLLTLRTGPAHSNRGHLTLLRIVGEEFRGLRRLQAKALGREEPDGLCLDFSCCESQDMQIVGSAGSVWQDAQSSAGYSVAQRRGTSCAEGVPLQHSQPAAAVFGAGGVAQESDSEHLEGRSEWMQAPNGNAQRGVGGDRSPTIKRQTSSQYASYVLSADVDEGCSLTDDDSESGEACCQRWSGRIGLGSRRNAPYIGLRYNTMFCGSLDVLRPALARAERATVGIRCAATGYERLAAVGLMKDSRMLQQKWDVPEWCAPIPWPSRSAA